MLKKCILCDFVFGIQCCHIIGIADWPPDTKIKIVNHPKNLVGLCRNHHFCLDAGLLSEEEIQKIIDPGRFELPTDQL